MQRVRWQGPCGDDGRKQGGSAVLAAALPALALLAVGAALPACAAERPVTSDAAAPVVTTTLAVSAPQPVAPGMEAGIASYYSRRFAGRRTASGERYDPAQMTAAHRSLPFGSWVEVRRTDGRRVIVRINDRGPHVSGRIIDLSYAAAVKLGLLQDGWARVELRVLAQVASERP